MAKQRKKFKDTKVGQFITKKLPSIAEDLLPEKGVLGIVKNLIDTDPDLTPEEKAQMHAEAVEFYNLEVADRDSARKREVEMAKAGRKDIMFKVTGIVGLCVFMYIVYAITMMEIPSENKEVWIHLIGVVEGIVISIFAYYFGSSKDKH